MADMKALSKAQMEFAAKALENMVRGICQQCGLKVEEEEQIGRSVYSKTCGHRLYQGTVGAFADCECGTIWRSGRTHCGQCGKIVRRAEAEESLTKGLDINMKCLSCYFQGTVTDDGKGWTCPECGKRYDWPTPDPSTGDKSEAEATVSELIRDLTDRHTLKQAWPMIPAEVRQEIAVAWTGIVLAALRRSPVDQVSGEPVGIMEYADRYAGHWTNKGDSYWLMRLMQEVGELASTLAGDHEGPLEHELKQVGSIAINWLRRGAPLTSNGGATAPEEEG